MNNQWHISLFQISLRTLRKLYGVTPTKHVGNIKQIMQSLTWEKSLLALVHANVSVVFRPCHGREKEHLHNSGFELEIKSRGHFTGFGIWKWKALGPSPCTRPVMQLGVWGRLMLWALSSVWGQSPPQKPFWHFSPWKRPNLAFKTCCQYLLKKSWNNI